MKIIQLTKSKSAMVDDDDFEWLSQWKWHAVEIKHRTTPSTWYARRYQRRFPLTRQVIYMHRAIIIYHGCSSECDVDHKDTNGLNNQFVNLRSCSQSKNNGNRVKEGNCSSKYKGVSWCNTRNKWRSMLRINKKAFGAKRFDSEEDAARHYDSLARLHFGEFARLNFP